MGSEWYLEKGGMIWLELHDDHDEGRISMSKKAIWRMGEKHGLIATGIMVLLPAMGGCAGEAPKPSSTMTQDQVRSNADKTFEKLKQEEKNRAVDSLDVPY